MSRKTENDPFIDATETLAHDLLDQIEDALVEKGINLDELIESSRKIRQEIYNEKYAKDE